MHCTICNAMHFNNSNATALESLNVFDCYLPLSTTCLFVDVLLQLMGLFVVEKTEETIHLQLRLLSMMDLFVAERT